MLQGGASLRLFRKLAPDRKNMLVFAGYCLPGTLGNDVQARVKRVNAEGEDVDVRCIVDYMSHSDHTDSRGIMLLISQVTPRHVVLVHGADKLMEVFAPMVTRTLGIPCNAPAVGATVDLGGGDPAVGVLASMALLRAARPVPAP